MKFYPYKLIFVIFPFNLFKLESILNEKIVSLKKHVIQDKWKTPSDKCLKDV